MSDTIFKWKKFQPELIMLCVPLKFLNNIVEQDHRLIKRVLKPKLGLQKIKSASWSDVAF